MQSFGTTYPRECLDLFDIFCEDRGLFPLMKSVELGNVVNLDVILDSIAKTDETSLEMCRARDS